MDPTGDLYFSLYGNNRKLKPQKIKTYALYKQLTDTRIADNYVIATNDTNEISVSFNGGSDCKVFTFDKVFYSNVAQIELYDSLAKPIIEDITMGLNSFLIVSKVASPYQIRSFGDKISFFDVDSIDSLLVLLLKELITFTKEEENMDSSLHVSYFEMHDNKIIDILSSCHEIKDMSVFEIIEQNYSEINGLVEKPLLDDKDIVELFTKQKSCSMVCDANCCCSVLNVTLIRKYINDGFELIKVGKITMVGFTKCRNTFLEDVNTNDSLLKFAENYEFPTSSKSKILDILRPAFGGNAKTYVIAFLSSVLYSLEKNLNILQFVSEIRNILNCPEIDLKLIVPDSLKEYADEIKELEKDIDATSKGAGIRLESLTYRFFKNSFSLENEKTKFLKNQMLCLTDDIHAKKQQLICLHTADETTESEIKEVEKSSEMSKLDVYKVKNENNVKEKVLLKADEIVTMKQMKFAYELHIKKVKVEIMKNKRNYEELMQNIHCLKGKMASLLCGIDAEQTSLKSTLELLMVDMNSTLSDSQTLQEDLLLKLKDFTDFDILLMMWKQNIENQLSKFSSFIADHDRNYNSIQLEMNSSLVSLHTSQNEELEIIRNNRNEKDTVLSYYFGKVQISCDSSFKILTEIIHQLDVMQSFYKSEMKSITATFCSSNQTFKKIVCDMNTILKSFQYYFQDQERELLQMTDMTCFHHKFKKQFDEKISDVKHSLLVLKQICLGHNDATVHKWNELQKDCPKIMQKNIELSEHLSVLHKETSKYVDNFAQQKLNALEYTSLKDKTDNVESRIQQLLQKHKEMEGDIGEASEVHKKGFDKELLEIKEYINSKKSDVEKYFDTYSTKLKNCSKHFDEELREMQDFFSNNKDELRKYLESLLLSVSCLDTIYNNYKSVSSNILEKSERSFKIMPSTSNDNSDNMPNFEDFILEDEWEVVTSTPSIPVKKELNLSYEKEKLLSRIKSVVEQQITQKSTIFSLDAEGKGNQHDISTMSLPNLNTHSKVPITTGKNFSKLKFSKK